MKLSVLFFCLFIVLKQFYLLESGSFQLGDACLMLSFFFGVIERIRQREKWKSERNIDIWFIIFVMATMGINGYYYLIYQDRHLLMASLYFVYIAIGVMQFRTILLEERALKIIQYCFRGNLYIQLVCLLCGFGEYKYEHRWCGTFNDPNQMAFFLMMCLFFSFLISEIQEKHARLEIVEWVIGIILLVLSKSVGITLGFVAFGGLYGCLKGYRWLKSIRGKQNRIKTLLPGLLILGIVTAIVCFTVLFAMRQGDDFSIFVRIKLKVESLFTGGLKGVLAERGMDKLWMAPLSLLYGAGDGAFNRYPGSNYLPMEMHNTPIGLWYCYGIIPFGILCIWIYKNIKKLPAEAYVVYAALLCESMFVVNYRQPFFWMLFELGWIWRISKNKDLGVLS